MQDQGWILEALPVGVWVGRVPDGQVAYANPAFSDIMGVAAVAEAGTEQAPGVYGIYNRSGSLYPPEGLPFSRVAATGLPAMVDDIVVHRPDGKKVNIRAFGHPVKNSAGALTHVVVAFVDITREIKSEVERVETEARLALAVNHAPIAIWSADSDGVVKVSEGAGLKSLGVKSGQLVGMNIFDMYKDHPTIPGRIRQGLAGASVQYSTQVGEASYDSWITPIRNAAGEVAGIAGLSHDVSEIRKLQSTTIQNDRVIALGTLAASVAHEINNPLTYMLSHATGLQDTITRMETIVATLQGSARTELTHLLDRLRGSTTSLQSGTERIASITRELRTFSRFDDQDESLVDVRAAANSVLQLVGKDLEARAMLLADLKHTAPVRGNPARLVQVVMNLVVNAMQALTGDNPHANEIGVATRNESDRVIIEVADTGPGVPFVMRDRIFEPFVSTKDVGLGTGLGLFVCRNIVRSMGGEIAVADRPGGGAIFRVTLPASAQPQLQPTSPVTNGVPPEAKAWGNVLIIDDDPMVVQVLCARLIAEGYNAVSVLNAEEGLAHLLENAASVDIAYCDLMMRGMTGMDLAAALEERCPKSMTKMVFMTGGAFTPRARKFLEEHAAQTVEKPFNIVDETSRRLHELRKP